MQVTPPEPSAVATFAAAIDRLTGGDQRPLLLAVSGGPDSLAMLLLAHAAMPDRIHAASVDHGLRPEATAEAAYVGDLCATLAVPHNVLTPDTAISGNIQSNARIIRYRLLHDHADAVDCHWIATAHHADDQLETILMRIVRGSGIEGMASIRPRIGRVLRPMLAFAKTELEAICVEAGIEPVRDPSNDDADFDRVALRQWLEQADHPFDAHRAVRTGAALADASRAIDWMVKRLAAEHLSLEQDHATLMPADLPQEIRRRLLQTAIVHIDPAANPRGEAIDRALQDLPRRKRFTLGNVLCEGGESWCFRPSPPRK